MIRTILPIVAVTIAMTGCVSSGTNFDRNFGDANRTLAAQQTRNPNAPVANREKLPDGMDGRSAREALGRYQRTFVDPPRAPATFTIGVSGASDTLGGGQR